MARPITKLKVCSVVCNLHGYRETDANELRVAGARAVLAWAAEKQADLVVLPAGYLRARAIKAASVHAAAAPVLRAAHETEMAVIVGVDACEQDFRVIDPTWVEKGDVPQWLAAWSPESRAAFYWRQRSTTSSDAHLVPEKASEEVRLLVVGRALVGVVACGEGFNPKLREKLLAAKPALAVMPAHIASGIRHWQALSRLAENGVPTLRAVHANEAENVLWRGKAKSEAIATERIAVDELVLEASLFAA